MTSTTTEQHPAPPTLPAPPAAPKAGWSTRRKVVVGIVVGFTLLTIGAGIGGANQQAPKAAPGSTEAPATEAPTTSPNDKVPGIGDPASDGQFTFIVQGVECGESAIGSGLFAEDAQGEYCLVDMKVRNTGHVSQMMDSSSQIMFIGNKEYAASSDAVLALDESENFFLEEINPGNSVSGVVVFDIPRGGKPDRLELHDSLFSGGVTVNI
jgi:hypothetical protein